MVDKKSKDISCRTQGTLGSAIYKNLIKKGYKNIIIKDKKQLDLLNQSQVFKFLKKIKPKSSYNCSCKSRGNLC